MILGFNILGASTFANSREKVEQSDLDWNLVDRPGGVYTEVAPAAGNYTEINQPSGTYTEISG